MVRVRVKVKAPASRWGLNRSLSIPGVQPPLRKEGRKGKGARGDEEGGGEERN